MKKFDLVYESILKSLLKEENEQKVIVGSKFDIRKDEDGTIVCYFDTKRDNNVINVVMTKKEGKKLSFVVTDQNGKAETLSNEEFAGLYHLDYDEATEAISKFENKEDSVSIDDSANNISDVKMFSDQLKAKDDDSGVKFCKTIEVEQEAHKKNKFIFSLLDDPAVDCYFSCEFQDQDKETSKITYFNSLIALKEANSVIIKIIVMNEEGQFDDIIAETDLKNRNPELAKALSKAIKIMEEDMKKRNPEIT